MEISIEARITCGIFCFLQDICASEESVRSRGFYTLVPVNCAGKNGIVSQDERHSLRVSFSTTIKHFGKK